MAYHQFNSTQSDDSEILGVVKRISNSPNGGKRVEVDAKFESKITLESDDMPYMAQSSRKGTSSSSSFSSKAAKTEKIKIDMNANEAQVLKKDDEIRARVRAKYAQSKQGGGGFGMGGGLSDVYEHVETLDKGAISSKGGDQNNRWTRFKT